MGLRTVRVQSVSDSEEEAGVVEKVERVEVSTRWSGSGEWWRLLRGEGDGARAVVWDGGLAERVVLLVEAFGLKLVEVLGAVVVIVAMWG